MNEHLLQDGKRPGITKQQPPKNKTLPDNWSYWNIYIYIKLYSLSLLPGVQYKMLFFLQLKQLRGTKPTAWLLSTVVNNNTASPHYNNRVRSTCCTATTQVNVSSCYRSDEGIFKWEHRPWQQQHLWWWSFGFLIEELGKTKGLTFFPQKIHLKNGKRYKTLNWQQIAKIAKTQLYITF